MPAMMRATSPRGIMPNPILVLPRRLNPVREAGIPEPKTLATTASAEIISPKSTAFSTFQDNPQRWLVEGKDTVTTEVEVTRVVGGTTETFVEERTVSVSYGLWLVDTSTATASPWSNLARTTAARSCYQTP